MPFRTVKDGRLLTTTEDTVYTVPSNRVPVLIEFKLINYASVAHTPEIYIIPLGQVKADKYCIWGGATSALKAGEQRTLRLRQFLEVGDFIQWKADANTVISAAMSITEETLDANTYKHVDADFLAATLSTWYTVLSSRQLTLLEILLHNTDSVARLPTIHAVPAAASAGDDNMIVGGPVGGESSLLAGETVRYLWNPHYIAGTTIQAKADSASKVTIKVSLIEEAA